MVRKLNNMATKKVNQQLTSQNVDTVRKGHVLRTAQRLLQPNNSVTTLEIKTALRKEQPGFYWDRDFISTTMDEFAQLGVFKYTFNGTFRTYFDPVRPMQTKAVKTQPAPAATPAPKKAKASKAAKTAKIDKWSTSSRISKSKALNMMQNNKGHFFSVQFQKKGDGTLRVMNCQYLPGQSVTLGVVKVKEAALVRAKDPNPIRSFDLNTVKKISIAGKVYNVK